MCVHACSETTAAHPAIKLSWSFFYYGQYVNIYTIYINSVKLVITEYITEFNNLEVLFHGGYVQKPLRVVKNALLCFG